MKTCLVVGASGWLGGRVVETLSSDGNIRVVATWHRRAPAAPPRANIRVVSLDITDADAVAELMAAVRPQMVIHAAAAISASTTANSVAEMTNANLIGTANLVGSSRDLGVQRFVFCSSVGVYGEESPPNGFVESSPTLASTPYGMSKLAGELLLSEAVRASGMEGVALRLGGIHGSGRDAGVIAGFSRQAIGNETLRVASPQSVFNFLFIEDAVRAVELAAKGPTCRPYASYNVAGDTPMSVEDLARTIVRKTCSSSEVVVADPRLLKYRVLDTGCFHREMGFVPRRFDQALDVYLDSLQAQRADR